MSFPYSSFTLIFLLNNPKEFIPCATKLWQNGELLSIQGLPRIPEEFEEKSPLQELYASHARTARSPDGPLPTMHG